MPLVQDMPPGLNSPALRPTTAATVSGSAKASRSAPKPPIEMPAIARCARSPAVENRRSIAGIRSSRIAVS